MTTKTDAVHLALVALWKTALPTVEVRDGPQANSDSANAWLFVGSNGDAPVDGMQAVQANQDWQAFQKVKQENADITCALVVVSGDSDTVGVRSLVYSYLGTAEDSVRADPTLGGLVITSGISSHQYYPALTQSGPKARLVFTLTYLAQI